MSVKRLDVATIGAIKRDLAKRKVELRERWLIESLKSLRSDGVINYTDYEANPTHYHFGAEERRVPQEINHESRLYLKQPKSTYADIGV